MKINIEDANKIMAVLDKTNGHAHTHTADWADIKRVARQAEAWLDERNVPKVARKGVEAHWRTAGPGKAYARKGRKVCGNAGVLRRGPSGWFLTHLIRADIWAAEPERLQLHLPTPTADAVRRFAFDGAVEIL